MMKNEPILSSRDIMPFFTPDIDSIDIAGRGSLETMASAIALAMVLRLPLVKAKMVIIGLFLKF